jgi:hypothetical protein
MKKRKKFEKNQITLNQDLYIKHFFKFLLYTNNNLYNIKYYFFFFNFFNYSIKIKYFLKYYFMNSIFLNNIYKYKKLSLTFDSQKYLKVSQKYTLGKNLYLSNYNINYTNSTNSFFNNSLVSQKNILKNWIFKDSNIDSNYNLNIMNDSSVEKWNKFCSDINSYMLTQQVLNIISYIIFIKLYNFYKFFIFLNLFIIKK